MREDSDLVRVKRVPTELEGLHLKGVLNREGVECELFSYHDTALDGISQNWAEGDWGELKVFEEDRDKAIEILREFEKSRPASGDDTEEQS